MTEDEQEAESEGEECSLPELSMEQLLGVGAGSTGPVGGSLRSFLGRRRLEPLPEEEDSLSVSSAGGGSTGGGRQAQQVGWW